MTQLRAADSDEFNGTQVAADWIHDLESTDSRLEKEKIIEKALIAAQLGSVSAQCFLHNCYLACNPYYVYSLRQVAETTGLTDRPNPWVEFWALIEGLRTRSITGHRARDQIVEISQEFDSEEWNGMARRVLIKDLRCGVSEKTLNRVLKNTHWAIPVFACQLAQDSAGKIEGQTGERRLEVKLDGVRVLATTQPVGAVNMFSRNGKPFNNFEHIEKSIAELSDQISQTVFGRRVPFVLDGEIVGKSFQDLMRQAHRKRDANASDAVFYIFDIVPRDDFQQGKWNTSQRQRIELLERIQVCLPEDSPVKIMPGLLVDIGTAEGLSSMESFAQDAIDQGYEGIMIKHLDAPYECRRNSHWLKWKPFIEVTLEVVDVEIGTGRNSDRLGAFVCSGQDDGKDIRVNVGSGFSDDQRSSFWAGRDDLIGQLVEIRADAVTQNQDGTYSLRFPRFKTFRGFDAGEKV